MAEMRKAIELNPQMRRAQHLGYTLAEKGVQLDEAEDLIRRAIALDPNDGFYVDSLAGCIFSVGTTARRSSSWNAALELRARIPPSEHLADRVCQTGRRRRPAALPRQRSVDRKEKEQDRPHSQQDPGPRGRRPEAQGCVGTTAKGRWGTGGTRIAKFTGEQEELAS